MIKEPYQDSFSRMFSAPLSNLLHLHVLKSSLVKADSDLTLEQPLSEGGHITQFLERQLVRLALVDVRYGRFGYLK